MAALTAALALLATACSGDGSDPGAGASSSSGAAASPSSATPTPTPTPVVPDLPVPLGVDLTPVGTHLTVGQSATVAYQLPKGEVGVLDITVTRIEKTTLRRSFKGWMLDEEQKRSRPYFVRVKITNRGENDLGGRKIPLYIVDGTNALVEATRLTNPFRVCEPGMFPRKFQPGRTAKFCLVFLAPNSGDLRAVSFRPMQEYDPIIWTGDLRAPKPPKRPKVKKSQN